MKRPHRRNPPVPQRWVLLVGLLGMMAACGRPAELTIVNGSDQTLTAVFDQDGADILDGQSLPPGTFIRLPVEDVEEAGQAELVAYGQNGACARGSGAAGERWEIGDSDLTLSGC